MRILQRIVLYSLLAFAGNTMAEKSVYCHNCSPSQKTNAAFSATNVSQVVFVFDFARSEYGKFEVNVEYDAAFGQITKTIFPAIKTSAENARWQDWVDLYEKLTAGPDYESGFSSAFDFLNNSNAWATLASAYRADNWFNWSGIVFNTGSILLSGQLLGTTFSPEIRVNFADGSYIIFTITDIDVDGANGLIFKFVPESAVDSDGNVIHRQPDARDYIGDSGSSSNPGGFSGYLEDIGIEVIFSSGNSSSLSCQWSCAIDGSRSVCTFSCSPE